MFFKHRETGDPQEIDIAGRNLSCQICKFEKFYAREGQLNTSFATFLGWEFLNPSATCFICGRCGYVHWFLAPNKK